MSGYCQQESEIKKRRGFYPPPVRLLLDDLGKGFRELLVEGSPLCLGADFNPDLGQPDQSRVADGAGVREEQPVLGTIESLCGGEDLDLVEL